MNRPTPTERASRVLEISRVFDAPREVVFRHLVEPDLIAQWWGPDGFTTPADQVEVDAVVGGAHRKTMVLESSEIAAGNACGRGPVPPRRARRRAAERVPLGRPTQARLARARARGAGRALLTARRRRVAGWRRAPSKEDQP